MSTLQRVCDEAARWGVVVKWQTPAAIDARPHTAPQHTGCVTGPGVVWWDVCDRRVLWQCGLWHDVLHALLWTCTGVEPYEQDEYGAFLWIEVEGQRRMRLPRRAQWMGNSLSPTGIQWGNLKRRERLRLLTDARWEALALGLVDTDGRPTYDRGGAA